MPLNFEQQNNHEQISNEDDFSPEKLQELFAEQKYDYILENLEKIPASEHQDTALKLIEAGEGCSVVENIDHFQELDYQAIALKLIEAGKGDYVAYGLEKFSGLNKEVALKLIEVGKGDYVAYSLEKFSGLNKEVALKLIEVGRGDSVANYLKKFSGLNHKEIASKLIEAGEGYYVVRNLKEFSDLDHQGIALKLIESGKGEHVVPNLEKFSDLDHQEIVLKLIEVGKGDYVVHNLEKFSGLNKEVALKLIEVGKGDYVTFYYEKFVDLDNEVALKLIEIGESMAVIRGLKRFKDVDHRDIALASIKNDGGGTVAYCLDQFIGLDHKEIANKIIEAGEGDQVKNNLLNFKGLDKEIAFKLLSFGLSLEKDRKSFDLSPEDEKDINQYVEQCPNNYLRLDEGLSVREELVKGEKLEEKDYQKIVEELQKNNPQWQDRDNVYDPLVAGAQEFGYRKMFRFMNRDDVSRHDQLYSFDKIIALYKNSGLQADEFFNNILDQVNKDESQYEDIGSSYHKLNVLAGTLSSDIDGILETIRENPHLLESFDSMPDLDKTTSFSSWKNLKKFSDITKILEQKDLLESLHELKAENKEALNNYVKKLMFHPNIDTQKVMDFWKNPESFLDIEEIHGAESHELKKPSNYVNIPNLDMTAEELRDALVEGYLDKIQDFQALEIEYELTPKTELDIMNTVALTSRALGKRSESIKGEAQSPNELFSTLNNIFKQNNLKLLDFLKLNNQSEIDKYFQNNPDLQNTIRGELFNEKVGLKRPAEVSQSFRAKINQKSDPDGVIAGNDTVNCMPFGSGKNNVYTFNPGCALFTLQRKNGEDEWRTVAESVLTKDKDIKKNIAEVLEQVTSVGSKLVDIVDKDVLQEQPSIITCDNIEVTPTFDSGENHQIIETIYRDFFQEYVAKYQQEENLDKSRVIIGKGYTDSLKYLPEVNNTFIPEAPLGYSDNLGHTALELNLTGNNPCNIVNRKITEHRRKKEQNNIDLPRGVEELTYRDTLAVSYIEGKAYHDNESLMEYMHNLENGLIAKDINNSSKHRDNLSLKYIGEDKAIHGYLIAYEGKKNDEAMIYIQDLASDGGARAGGSLIKGLLEKYKVHYLDKENPIPIYAEFREQTSFVILNKQLNNFSKQLGQRLVMDEIGNYEQGGDTMHQVMIRVE